MTKVAVQQFNLWGGSSAPREMNYEQKVAYVLEVHPETRGNDRLLLFWYWCEFDGLAEVLGVEALGRFRDWLADEHRSTSPETIRRRRQEHQRLGDGGGHLLPPQEEIRRRKKKAHQGRPRS